MRLVICWASISGYMAACWRALAATPEVELLVIAMTAPREHTFPAGLVAGLNCRLLDERERNDASLILSLVREHRPGVVYSTGWWHAPYRRLMADPSLASARKWIGIDTPWRGTLRQQVGRIAIGRYVRRMDRVFVPGERAWQYTQRLGVPEARVSRGLYGIDYDRFAPLYDRRRESPGGWPRRFLFVGRYHAEKGVPTLLDAYAMYRAGVPDPWPLTCCGSGELKPLLHGRDGVEDLGFVAPADLPDVLARSGAFVLSSHFDPWPLVVVESSAAGLPVICSEACGSSVELIRPHYNGLTVPTADAPALAQAMRCVHDRVAELPEWGRRAREAASAYSTSMFAARWVQALRADTAASRG